MTNKQRTALGSAVLAAVVLGIWLHRQSEPVATPPDIAPRIQGIGMLQGGYPPPWTATPAPSSGIFPTPHPDHLPSEIISNYGDFGDYSAGLVVAENAIESGVPGMSRLDATTESWVRPCDSAEGFGYYPSSPDAKSLLRQLLIGGGPPVVQGVYRESEDVFTMIVTELTSAEVDWPVTPTSVPTPTGTPPAGSLDVLRRPVLEHIPAEGYAVGVNLIVSPLPRQRPLIQGLYACEEGYYAGIEGLFFGWNVDSMYYARD